MTTSPDPRPNQHPNAPAYPAAPPPPMGRPGPVGRPPVSLQVSFWGWIAAALVFVIAGVLVLGHQQQVLDALRETNSRPDANAGQLQQLARTTVIAFMVVAIVIALLFVLFAVKLRAGRNWARIVLTVFAVLALISLISDPATAGVTSLAAEIIAIVSAILSYLPPSNAYISAAGRNR